MRKPLQLILAMALLLSVTAGAQTYPVKPVRIIVPYVPGGPVDALARELANAMSTALGQTFLVESRPGASGTLGTSLVANAAPDGYTLLIGAVGANINIPVLSTKPPYDGIKEFSPVVMALITSNILVVGQHLKVGTVREFIELAKTRPLSVAAAGTGGPTHIAGEIFQSKAKVKLTHVPYKGAAPVVTDLIGGHVDSAFLNLSAVMPNVKAGRLRALGVAAKTRSRLLPDVPTFEELGMTGFISGSWYGVLAPAGTPAAIVQSLYSAVAKHLPQPEVRARLEASGSELFLLDPAAFLAFMLEQKTEMLQVKKTGAITLDP